MRKEETAFNNLAGEEHPSCGSWKRVCHSASYPFPHPPCPLKSNHLVAKNSLRSCCGGAISQAAGGIGGGQDGHSGGLAGMMRFLLLSVPGGPSSFRQRLASHLASGSLVSQPLVVPLWGPPALMCTCSGSVCPPSLCCPP